MPESRYGTSAYADNPAPYEYAPLMPPPGRSRGYRGLSRYRAQSLLSQPLETIALSRLTPAIATLLGYRRLGTKNNFIIP